MPDHTYSVSHEELERLRRQIGSLKGQPLEVKHTATLIESMDRLHEALSRLIVIFESANRDMADDAARGIHDEHSKLDRILDQNEKIARAVVQLADIVKSQRTEVSRVTITNASQTEGQASAPQISYSRVDPPDTTRVNFVSAPATPVATPSYSTIAPTYSSPAATAAPTGLGSDVIMPVAIEHVASMGRSTLPAEPVQASTRNHDYPAPRKEQALPPLPALPPMSAPPVQRVVYPATLQPMPLQYSKPVIAPAQVPTPPQFLAPSAMPSPPRRQTAMSEQSSFVAQPLNQVQPAFAMEGPLSPLPPPPPPASKRTLLNRFSFN